jgi:HEAT repeat protein
LAARGEPRLAAAALHRLDVVPDLADRVPLSDTAAKDLAQLFADGARPLDLRRGAFDLAGRKKLVALQPVIEALASKPSEVQGAAVDALGQLRGGFPAARAEELLRSPDPAVRAAVARRAGDGVPTAMLRGLIASDPAPAVRASAVATLATREGPAANDVLIVALREEDSQIRGAAMRGWRAPC